MFTSKDLGDLDPAPTAGAMLLCLLLATTVSTVGCDKGGSGAGEQTAPARAAGERAPGDSTGAAAAADSKAAPCAGTPIAAGLPAGALSGMDVGRPVLALAFAPDGARLATGDAQGEVCLRDTGDAPAAGRRLGAHDGPVTAVAFLADGSRVVSAGADGSLRVWDAAAGSLLHTIDQAPAGKRRGQPPAGHTPAALWSMAAAPAGDQVVTGGWDGRLRLWSASSGQLVREVATLPFAVVGVAVSPDGKLAAVATEAELEAHLFDLSTGKRVSRASGYVDPPIGLAFAADGARIVSVDQRGNILSFARDEPGVYGAAQGHPLAGAAPGPAHAMAVGPDGAIVLVGGKDSVVVAGVSGGQTEARRRAVLAGHTGPVAALAVAPDGRTAASGGQDGRILLWSLDAADAGGRAGSTGSHAGRAGSSAGAIPAAYRALVDAGCDPERAGISTPIEARVLRNVPYAVAGRPFKSPELARLYASDGTWYQAGADGKIELTGADAACVATLKKHEDRLRKHAKLDAKVEAALTASPQIFHGLRALAIPGLRLGKGEQRSTEDQTYWVAPCNAGCQEVEMLCDADPGTGALTCQVSKQ